MNDKYIEDYFKEHNMRTNEEIKKICSKSFIVKTADVIQIELLMDIRNLLISIDNSI